jgi:hypothetical protein
MSSNLAIAVTQNQPSNVVGRPQVVGQHLCIVGHPHVVGQHLCIVGHPHVVGQYPHVVGQYPHVVGQYPHVVGQYPPNVGQYPPVNFNSAIGIISTNSSSYSASQALIEKRRNNDYYGDNPLGWLRD